MAAVSDASFETLQLEQVGRVLTVRFTHPPLNFMPFAFIRDLDRLTSAADRDSSVGAVVITGGIEGRFLTHLEVAELTGVSRGDPDETIAAIRMRLCGRDGSEIVASRQAMQGQFELIVAPRQSVSQVDCRCSAARRR